MPVNNPSLGSAFELSPLTAGESVIPRLLSQANIGSASGLLRLGYWTAAKTESITQVVVSAGSTAAAATPTLVRFGVYLEATNGDLSLLAATANDTTLLAAAFVDYQRSLTSTFNKVAGRRYAFGYLIVSAAATPTTWGLGGLGTEQGRAPRTSGQLTGQTDLPASITAGTIANNGNVSQAIWLP